MTENTTDPANTLAARDFVNPDERIDDEVLAGINDTAALAKYFEDTGAELDSIEDYGSGFELIDKARGKDSLIGVPFIIVAWRFSKGDNGHFVTAYIITTEGKKLILNDGSTGIRDQLLNVQERRTRAGKSHAQKALKVKNGLKRSDYDYTDRDSGEVKKATTYYLS